MPTPVADDVLAKEPKEPREEVVACYLRAAKDVFEPWSLRGHRFLGDCSLGIRCWGEDAVIARLQTDDAHTRPSDRERSLRRRSRIHERGFAQTQPAAVSDHLIHV